MTKGCVLLKNYGYGDSYIHRILETKDLEIMVHYFFQTYATHIISGLVGAGAIYLVYQSLQCHLKGKTENIQNYFRVVL